MWSVVRGCGDTITLWRSLCISSVMTYLDGPASRRNGRRPRRARRVTRGGIRREDVTGDSRDEEKVGQEVRGDEDELKTARTRRIHLLEAIDLRRLQDVQSREDLREDRKESLQRGDKRRRRPRPVLTLSCLKKHSILSSLKTLLQETRFWKTLGIFFKATLRPSRGSVTDLRGGAS